MLRPGAENRLAVSFETTFHKWDLLAEEEEGGQYVGGLRCDTTGAVFSFVIHLNGDMEYASEGFVPFTEDDETYLALGISYTVCISQREQRSTVLN